MSSRSKKKRLWREEKERRYGLGIGFYDSVINNLQIMQKEYENSNLAMTGTLSDEEYKKQFGIDRQTERNKIMKNVFSNQ